MTRTDDAQRDLSEIIREQLDAIAQAGYNAYSPMNLIAGRGYLISGHLRLGERISPVRMIIMQALHSSGLSAYLREIAIDAEERSDKTLFPNMLEIGIGSRIKGYYQAISGLCTDPDKHFKSKYRHDQCLIAEAYGNIADAVDDIAQACGRQEDHAILHISVLKPAFLLDGATRTTVFADERIRYHGNKIQDALQVLRDLDPNAT